MNELSVLLDVLKTVLNSEFDFAEIEKCALGHWAKHKQIGQPVTWMLPQKQYTVAFSEMSGLPLQDIAMMFGTTAFFECTYGVCNRQVYGVFHFQVTKQMVVDLVTKYMETCKIELLD